MVRLVFLGRLENVAGVAHMNCPLAEPTTLADLLGMLPTALAEALQGPKVRVARNGTVAGAEGLVVQDGDELAFLPPVSGG